MSDDPGEHGRSLVPQCYPMNLGCPTTATAHEPRPFGQQTQGKVRDTSYTTFRDYHVLFKVISQTPE